MSIMNYVCYFSYRWKNNNDNPFKLDKRIRLQFLPTLLKWGTLHKLQVEECLKPDLLNMIDL